MQRRPWILQLADNQTELHLNQKMLLQCLLLYFVVVLHREHWLLRPLLLDNGDVLQIDDPIAIEISNIAVTSAHAGLSRAAVSTHIDSVAVGNRFASDAIVRIACVDTGTVATVTNPLPEAWVISAET